MLVDGMDNGDTVRRRGRRFGVNRILLADYLKTLENQVYSKRTEGDK
jgi:hypothetical protein